MICLLELSEKLVQEQQKAGIDDKDPSLPEPLLNKEKNGTEESTGTPSLSHWFRVVLNNSISISIEPHCNYAVLK